jgi:hypothetical protein
MYNIKMCLSVVVVVVVVVGWLWMLIGAGWNCYKIMSSDGLP